MQFWVVWKSERKRWIVTYKGDDGKRHQRAVPDAIARDGSAAGKRVVEAWAVKELAKPVDAKPAFAEPTTRELVAKFLEHVAQDERVEKATSSGYSGHLTQWVLPFTHNKQAFAEMTLPDVNVPYMCAFVRHLRAKRAPQTTRNILSSLAKMITVARAQEWTKVDRNVAQDDAVRSELPELEHREVEVLSHEAIAALVTDEDVPLVWRLRYGLGALAGLEDGVVAGLRAGDIERDEDGYTLLIRRAVKICGADGWASVGDTKNKYRGTEKAPRRVPVHPVLAALIDEWLADGWELWTGKGRGPEADDWLLPRTDGEAWRPRSAEMLREHLAKLGIRAQIGASEFKQLRAWFATELEATGATDATRKRLMGHRGTSVAARHYTAEQRDLDRRAVEGIRIYGAEQGTASHTQLDEHWDHNHTAAAVLRMRHNPSQGCWSNGRNGLGLSATWQEELVSVQKRCDAEMCSDRQAVNAIRIGEGDGRRNQAADRSDARKCNDVAERTCRNGSRTWQPTTCGCSRMASIATGAATIPEDGRARTGAVSVPVSVPPSAHGHTKCDESGSHLRDLNSRPTVYEVDGSVPHAQADQKARDENLRVRAPINGTGSVNGTDSEPPCAERVPDVPHWLTETNRAVVALRVGWDAMEMEMVMKGYHATT